jgi:CRISPR/Cas system CSM-associated protein Csm4 (group 5 of RAMP superfamily)
LLLWLKACESDKESCCKTQLFLSQVTNKRKQLEAQKDFVLSINLLNPFDLEVKTTVGHGAVVVDASESFIVKMIAVNGAISTGPA